MTVKAKAKRAVTAAVIDIFYTSNNKDMDLIFQQKCSSNMEFFYSREALPNHA